MSQNKKGLRWWLFNRFGPPEVQNLIDHIDDMTNDGEFDIAIYPMGQFAFTVRTSVGEQQEPFVFPTDNERRAFAVGLNYGVSLYGGQAHALTEEQFETIDEMNKKSTHGGGGGRNN
jgi:hypothetical protein